MFALSRRLTSHASRLPKRNGWCSGSRLMLRTFYDAKADFISFDKQGSLSTRTIDVIVGEPHEDYIHLKKEIGFAMRSAIVSQTGVDLSSDPEKVPLVFSHDSRHFAHEDAPYPRVVLRRDLPRQNSSDKSPATLWLWGAAHCLTLDGTADHSFTESMRESNQRLKGAMKLLENM